MRTGRACSLLGMLLSEGEGARDEVKGRAYYETGCSMDDGLGCAKLVYLWMRGEAGPRDETKARQYAEKACSLGQGSGCSNLGFLWANGEGGPRDVVKGREYAQKGCSLGDPDACANLRAFMGNAASPSCEEQCQKLAKDGSLRAGMTLPDCIAALCPAK